MAEPQWQKQPPATASEHVYGPLNLRLTSAGKCASTQMNEEKDPNTVHIKSMRNQLLLHSEATSGQHRQRPGSAVEAGDGAPPGEREENARRKARW